MKTISADAFDESGRGTKSDNELRGLLSRSYYSGKGCLRFFLKGVGTVFLLNY